MFIASKMTTLGGQAKRGLQSLGYVSATDNIATVSTAGYFNEYREYLTKGDLITFIDTAINSIYQLRVTVLGLSGDIETVVLEVVDLDGYATETWVGQQFVKLDQTTPQTITGLADGYLNLSGGVITSTVLNITNWNTAYGWGNHASAGYLTTTNASSTYVPYTGATQDVNLGEHTLTTGGTQTGQSKIASGLVVNESGGNGANDDLRAETVSNANAFVVDASANKVLVGVDTAFDTDTMYVDTLNNRVGFGTASPRATLDVMGTARLGNSTTNYTSFEADGTMVAVGSATCFRDELNDLIKSASQNPSSHLVFDYTEGTLDFKNNCDLNDWALMNIQVNHDWKSGSDVEPHIHWFQNANNTPNWLIQYRWQRSCNAKTTSWTSKKYTTNACTYTSGTIHQITSFGAITPPSGYGISDILQIRILRDTANASTLFAGADPYTGDAEAISFDVHIEVDTLGSRQLYVK